MNASQRFVRAISVLLWLFLLSPALVLFLSFGAVAFRASFGTSYLLSLSLSGMVEIGLLALYLQRERSFLLRSLLVTLCVTSILYLGFCRTMYHRAFQGLVSTGGGDAADHLYYRFKFLTDEPSIYHGFSGFSSLTHLIEVLFGANAYYSFEISFFLIGFLIILSCSLIFSSVLYRCEKNLNWRVVFATFSFLLLAYYPLRQILFPLISYLQGEGFYPQLAGLVPLFFGSCFYIVGETYRARLLGLAVTLVFYRFSYGLNLPDLVFVVAILSAIEGFALKDRKHLRRLSLLLSTFLLLLAAYLYSALWQLYEMKGALLAPDMWSVFLSFVVVSGSLILSGIVETQLGERFRRLCLYSGTFGFASTSIVGVLLCLHFTPHYYLYKYTFHPAALLCCSSFIVGTLILQSIIFYKKRSPRRVLRSSLVLLGLGGGLLLQRNGFEIYRPHFEERVAETIPPVILEPLADLSAWKIIDHRLEQTGSRFGGFVATPSWPLSGFMNAAFQYYHYREPRLHSSGRVRLKPGYCVFWNSTEEDFKRIEEKGSPQVARSLRALGQRDDTVVEVYQVPWSIKPKQISSLCINE